ncbi:MAG: endonuclease/exonuclease/phosphatase family protein [Mucinivorans sp.]
MKTILRAFGWLFMWIMLVVVIFLGVIWAMAYQPSKVEELPLTGSAEVLSADTIKIVSWNIGYAGLGADMDYFYDGGQSVQCSRGRTIENLRRIADFLRANADADFILLQEVDLDSKRSYNINEYDTLLMALGRDFSGYVALNYVSPFVPYPFYNPIGGVRGGLVTFTRHTPRRATRYAYPGGFSWPMSMFNLKRCLLALEVPLSDSATLYVSNTHNTAYDTGGMRAGELEFLKTMYASAPHFVVAGDWNSNPAGYKATNAEIDNEYFSPLAISKDFFPKNWHTAYDTTKATARYGYQPYDSTQTTRTTIDFMVCGPQIELLKVNCIDLGFENSDHNPVVYSVKILRGGL